MSPPLATYHFNLTVNSRQEAKIRIMAKERGLPFETYCQMFFEAAYAAKVGLCPDAGLDARVRAAMILVGASVPAIGDRGRPRHVREDGGADREGSARRD